MAFLRLFPTNNSLEVPNNKKMVINLVKKMKGREKVLRQKSLRHIGMFSL